MKIKTMKKMRLDELLKNVWDGNLPAKTYASDRFTEIVNVKQNGVDFRELKFGDIHKNTTYTVEVEEIVTPTTRFDELTEYIYDSNDDHHFTAEHKGADISLIIDCETHQFKTQAIYCKDTLIWSKEHGIPESGVLEVDAE